MNGPDSGRVLVLGGPSVGKSTFLLQLYGRIIGGDGALSIRSAPESLGVISNGLERLQQGLPVSHTPHGTDANLELQAKDKYGRPVEITVPEYAGEDLRRVGDGHRLPERWNQLSADCDHWLVMVRLSLYPEVPDLITRPIGEVARTHELTDSKDLTTDQPLPIDMLTVELLQVLQHARRQSAHGADASLQVTLVLSCWDELDLADGTIPKEVAHEKLALIDSYCVNQWGSTYRVRGLSSQGRPLSETSPSDDFIDHGPQGMGWFVDERGERDNDLTELIATE